MPKTFDDIENNLFKDEWLAAVREELSSLEKFKVKFVGEIQGLGSCAKIKNS